MRCLSDSVTSDFVFMMFLFAMTATIVFSVFLKMGIAVDLPLI